MTTAIVRPANRRGWLPAALVTLVGALVLATASVPAFSYITYTDSQRETVVELIEQLEQRHSTASPAPGPRMIPSSMIAGAGI